MDTPPSMWRAELWHPLVVHFPIALLVVGTTLRLLGMGHRRHKMLRVAQLAGRLLLIMGTVGAWAAIYTGSIADAAVARALCDPTVVEQHERWAYVIAWLFTAIVVVDGFTTYVRPLPHLGRLSLRAFLIVSLLVGCGGLGYVGHLGATLVYQQGAAVYDPAPDCAAFE